MCVIVAGDAGLTAATHLKSYLNVSDVSPFEQATGTGGTCVYDKNTGKDKRGFPHPSFGRNIR